ncbi:MAG: 6-phosphogluconolactonase [Polyangiaceae bacterium]|nr:6-phosphogluconolactonase [Polyangiaceae bacterium]
MNWSRVQVQFGDERCVPPDDEASNHRMGHETLLAKAPLPDRHVHRVLGEQNAGRSAAECEAVAHVRLHLVMHPRARPHVPPRPCVELHSGVRRSVKLRHARTVRVNSDAFGLIEVARRLGTRSRERTRSRGVICRAVVARVRVFFVVRRNSALYRAQPSTLD